MNDPKVSVASIIAAVVLASIFILRKRLARIRGRFINGGLELDIKSRQLPQKLRPSIDLTGAKFRDENKFYVEDTIQVKAAKLQAGSGNEFHFGLAAKTKKERPDADHRRRLADRKDEIRLFGEMLRGETLARVLLLEGESEFGKSILLAEFAMEAERILGPQSCSRTDFKGGLLLDELFSHFYADLGERILVSYGSCSKGMAVHVSIQTDLGKARLGDENRIEVQPTIQANNVDATRQRGDAILHDLRTWQEPIVLIIDTFDAATEEASRWITHQLLPLVRYNPALFVAIAGKVVPRPHEFNLSWGPCANHLVLKPVTSVDEWHEFACSYHSEFPRQYIEGVCKGGLTSRPSIIREFIGCIVRQLPPGDKNRGS